MSTDIVVARYNEDVSWISSYIQYDYHIKIYNKGQTKVELEDNECVSIYNLPNIGREAHTYLHYIITNYNNLPDRVVFTQANPFDHCNAQTLLHVIYLSTDGMSLNAVPVGHMKKTDKICNYNGHELIDSGYTLGEVYDNIFEIPFPEEGYKIYFGAIFSVSSELIRKYPLSFYEKLLEYISVGQNPEFAHFMEWSWYNIFNYVDS